MGWIGTAAPQLSFPEPVPRAKHANSDAALAELMAGNERFVTRRITSDAQDLAILKQKQTPKSRSLLAAVLSCADSRVPVELVFDQTIGLHLRDPNRGQFRHLRDYRESGVRGGGFGNEGDPGHGTRRLRRAVKATAIQGAEAPGQISALFPHIQPAVDQAGNNPGSSH